MNLKPANPAPTRRAVVGSMIGLALGGIALTPEESRAAAETPAPAVPLPVAITVDAGQPVGEMKPIWRFFGADEPNYATMKNGRKLLGELGEMDPERVFFRTHNLLTSGDGKPALKWGSTNAYTEDAHGNPVYDWTILNGIFDAYRANHVRPYVQIGFMPEALSIKPEPYRHHWTSHAKYDEIYTGWAYPPKDYAKWEELVFQWTRHCVERYGRTEVETWYWETWNEPNIGYWRGTPDEFRMLHDHAIAGVRRALPNAKVGGPDCAGGAAGHYLHDFLEHCLRGTNHATGQTGTPLDFLSFHAKGAPKFVTEAARADGSTVPAHVRMGISNQLNDIDRAFAAVAAFPELKNTPIVIGESDPDGCAACQGPQLGYRNSTLYSSYTAASFARKYLLADRHGVNLEGALTWAFEFEDQPLFAGFRVLASGGLDLPVLNVFRMFAKMGTSQRVRAESTGQVSLDAILKEGVRGNAPDIGALATRDGDKIAVMVWHYHDDDLPGTEAGIDLAIKGLPVHDGTMRLSHWRIDSGHSNAYTEWLALGSPAEPSPEQYAHLEQAGKLARLTGTPDTLAVQDGTASLHFDLPRQGISLIVLG